MPLTKIGHPLRAILFFIVLYIYLYNPIFKFIGFGSIKLLLFLSLIFILLSNKVGFIIKSFSKEIFFTFLLVLYNVVWAIFGGIDSLAAAYTCIVWFLEAFIIPILIIFQFKDFLLKYEFKEISIFVGFIASLITFILILNPNINIYIRDNVIVDSLDLFSNKWTYRGFAIAESSAFGYGIIQGLILGICLFQFQLQKKYLYFIPIIFLFISIIFNSRIGMAPVAIAIVLYITNKKFSFTKIIVLALTIYIGSWVLTRSSFSAKNATSIEWGLSFFTDTFNFLTGKDQNSNYSVLFGDMLFIPDNTIDLFFGTGQNIFLEGKRTTDVGYVLQIYQGGLFYLTLMLLFLIYLFRRCYKKGKDKSLPFLFVLTILLVNIKGNALFVSNSFFRLFTLYYVYVVVYKKFNHANLII